MFETKLSLSSDNVPVELDAIADLYDDLVSSKTTMQEEIWHLHRNTRVEIPYCQTIAVIHGNGQHHEGIHSI